VEGDRRGTPRLVTTGLDEVLDEEPVDYSGLYAVYDGPVIEASSEEHRAWYPIVTLLLDTRPKDLVFDCGPQFPPCLLMHF
jgi:hypothetical protein